MGVGTGLLVCLRMLLLVRIFNRPTTYLFQIIDKIEVLELRVGFDLRHVTCGRAYCWLRDHQSHGTQHAWESVE